MPSVAVASIDSLNASIAIIHRQVEGNNTVATRCISGCVSVSVVAGSVLCAVPNVAVASGYGLRR